MFRTALSLFTVLGTLSTAFGYQVTSDDSGKYLAAIGSPLKDALISKDYGSTWTVSDSNNNWSCATSDSTGKKLNVASSQSGSYPYYSKNEGATWNVTNPSNAAQGIGYLSIASDASGDYVWATGTIGAYQSRDGGYSWSSYQGGGTYGLAAAVSGDGSTAYIGFNNVISYYSKSATTKYDQFVPTNVEEAYWSSISTDYTGRVIAGSFNMMPGYANDGVYISEDRGATYFDLRLTNTGTTFNGVKVTSDGTMLYYVGSSGVRAYNFTSKTTVTGVLDKPTTSGNPLSSVSASKNGKYVVIGSYDHVWVSSDYGVNFKQTK